MDEQRKHQLLQYLVQYLLDEAATANTHGAIAAATTQDLWDTFRALVNTRLPMPASEEFLAQQDELLQGLIAESGITHLDSIAACAKDGRIRLWQGDITTLAVDAIVNAANSQMLGCWVPGHFCIDNAIHTFAGVQLRLACNELMQKQGHEEPTAQAKITPAFNLPSEYVIHTVGPIAAGAPTLTHCEQLAQCYRVCLDCAVKAGCSSIAFCCISTGVFGFPQQQAAEIAVEAVCEWLNTHTAAVDVVFNVFGTTDKAIYRTLLESGSYEKSSGS